MILKPGSKITNKHIKHQKKNLNNAQADNMKILLVEDNIINQQLAFDTLKTWNSKINIDLANNGRIALEKVKESDYDLILMDIQMPEMDGNEATLKIRELPDPKNSVPIMAMTAHALKNEKENCLDMGMNDYISKPFEPEELFAKVLNFAPVTNQKKVSNKIEYEVKINKDSEDNNSEYKYFHTTNLVKIYNDNKDKIVKIVSMCYDSIPDEIVEIQKAYDNQLWEILRNKAHSLKPKLGYMGMENMQNKAKDIEIYSQQDDKKSEIQQLIIEIREYWQLATPELKQFINS